MGFPVQGGTAAVILGADSWPHFLSGGEALNGGRPFANSARLAEKYLRSEYGFSLTSSDILNLFNSEQSASAQCVEIEDFLESWKKVAGEKERKLADLFIYYVGHGDFYGAANDLLMLVADSRPGHDLSGIQSRALANVLKRCAPFSRQVIVLDCCWSGAAIRHWQSATPAQAAAASVNNNFPRTGTVLLCSSSEKMPSMAPAASDFTLFSKALFETLFVGSAEISGEMSAREVKELAFDRMEKDWPDVAVRPVAHGIERGGGDLSEKPYFQNSPHDDRRNLDELLKLSIEQEASALDKPTKVEETLSDSGDGSSEANRRPQFRLDRPPEPAPTERSTSKRRPIPYALVGVATLAIMMAIWIFSYSGEVIEKACQHCPELVQIPGGEFDMGVPEDEESPRHDFSSEVHKVEIYPFMMAKTETTFEQWEACVSEGGCKRIVDPNDMGWGRGSRPVINVNYFDIAEYIDWLNTKTSDNERYRLPTEAEWEFAARAGSSTPFATGYRISREQANFDGQRPYGDSQIGPPSNKTVPVTDLDASNGWGLRHMHGNVWEWTQDCWHDSYVGHPVDGSAWLEGNGGDCERRVVRGGGFGNAAINLRSGERSAATIHQRSENLGFRVVKEMEPAQVAHDASSQEIEESTTNLVVLDETGTAVQIENSSNLGKFQACIERVDENQKRREFSSGSATPSCEIWRDADGVLSASDEEGRLTYTAPTDYSIVEFRYVGSGYASIKPAELRDGLLLELNLSVGGSCDPDDPPNLTPPTGHIEGTLIPLADSSLLNSVMRECGW